MTFRVLAFGGIKHRFWGLPNKENQIVDGANRFFGGNFKEVKQAMEPNRWGLGERRGFGNEEAGEGQIGDGWLQVLSGAWRQNSLWLRPWPKGRFATWVFVAKSYRQIWLGHPPHPRNHKWNSRVAPLFQKRVGMLGQARAIELNIFIGRLHQRKRQKGFQQEPL